MKHRTIFLVFCIVIVLLLQTSVAAQEQGKHALLIGIQHYGGDVLFQSLRGPVNDVEIVGEMLRERFGLENDQITLLLDNYATHSGIKQAFEALNERVQDNDFVYIHYSGHGSQTANLNAWKGDNEPDGKDETWVSYESRSGKGEEIDNYDVLDDNIDAWLAAIYVKTKQVVFVSDSCHSATVSRGESVISRAVEEDQREHPLGEQDYTPLTTYPGIRVGAARDRESAIEFPAEESKYYGLFTYFWVQALQQARDGETWNDVFKRAYTRVTADRGDVQRPQIWGESRGLKLGGGFTGMKPTIAVSAVQDKVVTIQAGSLAGVTVGSVYRLYAPETHPSPLPGGENPPEEHPPTPLKGEISGGDNPPLPLPGGELPTLEITETGPFVSYGKPNGTFKPGDLVIEERHAYQFAPIKVYVQADDPEQTDKPVLEAIRSAFTPAEHPLFPAYTLTDDPDQADLHLYVLRPKQENGQYLYNPESQDVLPLSFPDQPPEVWVLTPEHRLLYENLKISFADQAHGMMLLQENLNKFARLRDLKTLESPREMPKVEIDVYQLTPEECEGEPDCVKLPGKRGWHRKIGPFPFQDLGGDTRTLPFNERFTFTLRNESDREYYCYLLDIMPDGAVSAIFPNPNLPLEDALIEAGGSRDLTQESSFIANMKGEETLKFIVTDQPIEVPLLEREAFLKGEEVPERGPLNPLNPLERLLQHALSGERGTDHYPVDEWATEQVSFEVLPIVEIPDQVDSEEEFAVQISLTEEINMAFEQEVQEHRRQLGTLIQDYQYMGGSRTLIKTYMKKLTAISMDTLFETLQDYYPSGTSVLFYGYKKNDLGIWLIDENGIQVYKRIDISEENLDRVIFELRQALRITSLQLSRLPPDIQRTVERFTARGSEVSLDGSIAGVTNILLPPECIGRLSSTQHLIIVPTLGIGTVPFSMLQPFGTEQYLVDQMSITIAPSLFNIAEGVRTWHTHPTNPLIMGNPLLPAQWPRLPGAEKEAKSIATVFNASPLIGKDATEEAVERLSRSADLLYFATHGIGDRKHPVVKSFLALSKTEDTDGQWTIEEIQQKGLRANLAVLSACQTGLGKEFDAGIVGLSRAFQLAGVPRVVMSLWNVDDEVTSELMQSFAQHLQKDVPSEALRQAMLDIKQYHPHPSKWASFTLFGDAR